MTNKIYFFLLIFSAITTSAVQVLLKIISSNHQENYFKAIFDPLTFVTLLLYVIAFVGWFISLSKIHFSIAIPVSSISIIASAIIGHFVFNESIGANKIIAFSLITLSMVFLYIDAIKH
jgi:multidrug transporter EmrE-like cation transporter